MNHPEQQSETSLHAVDYWQVIKNRYGVILLTLLLVFMTASVITYVMPRKYESYATIEVKPREKTIDPLGEVMRSNEPRMTARFFGTEFEKIKSRNSLGRVIDKLDLMKKWGMDRESVLLTLKGIVNTQNIRETDLISITVRHTNKDDARDIAVEVALAYKDYRTELEGKSIDKGVSELKKAVREQGDKVEERRKILTTISRDSGIIYRGDASLGGQGGLEEDQEANYILKMYTELEGEKMQLESQIQSLLKYDSEQLLIYASALDLPDNIIKTLYPQYLALKRDIDGLKASGLGNRHPDVESQTRILKGMKEDLDEGVVNLRTRLQGQLEMSKERLYKLELKKTESKKEALETNIEAQDYIDAKRDFETDLALLGQMKLQLMNQELTQGLPNETIVIHDDPVVSESPVSPNVTLNLVLGAVVGLVFGVGIAFFLESRYLREKP